MAEKVVELVPGITASPSPEGTLKMAIADDLEYVIVLARDKDGDFRVYSNSESMLEGAFLAQKLIHLIHEGAFEGEDDE